MLMSWRVLYLQDEVAALLGNAEQFSLISASLPGAQPVDALVLLPETAAPPVPAFVRDACLLRQPRWVIGLGGVPPVFASTRHIVLASTDRAAVIPQLEVLLATPGASATQNTGDGEPRRSDELQALVAGVPGGLVLLDADLRVITCDRHTAAAQSGSRYDMVGRRLGERVPWWSAEVDAACREALTRDTVVIRDDTDDAPRRGPDPDQLWRVSCFPVALGAARAVGVLAQDVTELKLAARRHRETQLQIWHAQKVESLGRLAGGIAHDFNNLLTALSAFAELLRLRLAGRPEAEFASQILAAAERAAALTRQMVAISGRQVVSPGPVDLNTRVTAMLSLLRGMLGSRVSVRLDLSAEQPNAIVDQGQLDQVVMNLTLNARDAMPEGGVLAVSTARRDVVTPVAHPHGIVATGTYAVLEIADEGHGMDADVLRHAFEPFFSTKPPGKGSGLGLATTFGIVSQARGHITLDSVVGAGTVVTVYLPFQPSATAPLEPAAPVVVPPRKSILLAEDDDIVRELTAEMLTSAGYVVEVAEDGTAALRLIEHATSTLDLLLTDLVMPGTPVAEVVRRWRERRPGAAVICTSGYAESDLVQHGVMEHGVGFVAKPYSRADLLRRVAEALEAAAVSDGGVVPR